MTEYAISLNWKRDGNDVYLPEEHPTRYQAAALAGPTGRPVRVRIFQDRLVGWNISRVRQITTNSPDQKVFDADFIVGMALFATIETLEGFRTGYTSDKDANLADQENSAVLFIDGVLRMLARSGVTCTPDVARGALGLYVAGRCQLAHAGMVNGAARVKPTRNLPDRKQASAHAWNWSGNSAAIWQSCFLAINNSRAFTPPTPTGHMPQVWEGGGAGVYFTARSATELLITVRPLELIDAIEGEVNCLCADITNDNAVGLIFDEMFEL